LLIDTVDVVVRIILPLMVVTGVGYLARRWMKIEVATLVTLNLYFFVPAYLLSRLTQVEIPRSEFLELGLGTVLPVLTGSLVLGLLLMAWSIPRAQAAGLVVGSFFYNSANFGIPVAELAFGPDGGRQQAIVVMFTSLMMFFVGYGILAVGQGSGLGAVRRFFRMPFLYVALIACTMQWLDLVPPEGIRHSLDLLAAGMLPIALMTLGAQLAQQRGVPKGWMVMGVVCIKLLIMPVLAWCIVHLLGLWPSPGRLLVLAAAAPTAVNTLIVTLDVDGDAEFAANCVFWSTVFSSITVAGWLLWLGPI
jgi:predicted permease